MLASIEERVAYGRSIRDRAECLLEAHGPEAEAEALSAAGEPGMAAADRAFWEAVAARVSRLTGQAELADLAAAR
jgi:hypothetical protein